MQTIAQHVIILGLPDYSERPAYGLRYATDVTQGGLGTGYSETRNIRWPAPRRSQEWVVKTHSGAETFALEESIRSALESKKAAVAWLPHLRGILAVGSGALALDSYAPMPAGTLLWWLDKDTRAGGYATSTGQTGTTVTFSGGAGLTARCYIAPLMFGLLESASATGRTLIGSTYTLRFAEGFSGGAAPVITIPLEDYAFEGEGGETVTLRAMATGREPITCAWTRNGTAVPGDTLELSIVAGLSATGLYTLTVSNDFGSASTSATVGQIEAWDGTQNDELETVDVARVNGATLGLTFTGATETTAVAVAQQTEGATLGLTFTGATETTAVAVAQQTEEATLGLTFIGGVI